MPNCFLVLLILLQVFWPKFILLCVFLTLIYISVLSELSNKSSPIVFPFQAVCCPFFLLFSISLWIWVLHFAFSIRNWASYIEYISLIVHCVIRNHISFILSIWRRVHVFAIETNLFLILFLVGCACCFGLFLGRVQFRDTRFSRDYVIINRLLLFLLLLMLLSCFQRAATQLIRMNSLFQNTIYNIYAYIYVYTYMYIPSIWLESIIQCAVALVVFIMFCKFLLILFNFLLLLLHLLLSNQKQKPATWCLQVGQWPPEGGERRVD